VNCAGDVLHATLSRRQTISMLRMPRFFRRTVIGVASKSVPR